MKKKSLFSLKGFIPAIAMVLASATMLGGVTYAWFSTNTDVTVSGLSLTANTEDVYLLISESNAQIAAPSATNTSITYTDATANLFPSALKASSDPATVGSWITATSDDPASYNSNLAQDDLTSFTNYVIHKTLYVSVAAGGNTASDLTATLAVTKQGEGAATVLNPVSVVFKTTKGVVSVKHNGTTGWDVSTVLLDSITAAPQAVEMFVYYDGENTAVYTNNKANLAGASIVVTFDVTPDAGA